MADKIREQNIVSFEGTPHGVKWFAENSADGTQGLQSAALCFQIVKGKIQILLVTSRDTGRWIVPKGWPMPGLTAAQTAAREAFEEAGVLGDVSETSIGHYPYIKLVTPHEGLPCTVSLFPLRVAKLCRVFPERRQRQRKWLSAPKAALLVQEPELAELLAAFDPGAFEFSKHGSTVKSAAHTKL